MVRRSGQSPGAWSNGSGGPATSLRAREGERGLAVLPPRRREGRRRLVRRAPGRELPLVDGNLGV